MYIVNFFGKPVRNVALAIFLAVWLFIWLILLIPFSPIFFVFHKILKANKRNGLHFITTEAEFLELSGRSFRRAGNYEKSRWRIFQVTFALPEPPPVTFFRRPR